MKQFKQLAALFLAFALVIGLFSVPTVAYAEEKLEKTTLSESNVTVDYVTEDTRNESKNVTNTWSQISSTFSTGITFQMTENMTLDSTMNFGKTGLDSFDRIFKNLTIGATVKF